jgi:hypothetical protein
MHFSSSQYWVVEFVKVSSWMASKQASLEFLAALCKTLRLVFASFISVYFQHLVSILEWF